jgi:hypothetical protein
MNSLISNSIASGNFEAFRKHQQNLNYKRFFREN